MLSYFAAWILKAGTPVLRKRSDLRHRWGNTGGGRSRQLRDGGQLARELQLVQENARTIFVRGAAFAPSRGQPGRPVRGTRQEDLR
jgi:hypothetical protein